MMFQNSWSVRRVGRVSGAGGTGGSGPQPYNTKVNTKTAETRSIERPLIPTVMMSKAYTPSAHKRRVARCRACARSEGADVKVTFTIGISDRHAAWRRKPDLLISRPSQHSVGTSLPFFTNIFVTACWWRLAGRKGRGSLASSARHLWREPGGAFS